ncbi:hypothetical protein IAD21_05359 [Abditibacteriota bacterium]|nr:hypothetical protein IAD21_05359 [Abditibacteriota bacterium]
MNYDTVKTHLENAHRVLIHSGEDLDLQDLAFFDGALKRKEWRAALSALEECGAATPVNADFWREMLNAARELDLPRYQARIEKQLKLSGE